MEATQPLVWFAVLQSDPGSLFKIQVPRIHLLEFWLGSSGAGPRTLHFVANTLSDSDAGRPTMGG